MSALSFRFYLVITDNINTILTIFRKQDKRMDLIREQFPIVIHSLNIGFLQTLKLFFVTLIGALPLGLVIPWYAADDPAADHLLFSRPCTS